MSLRCRINSASSTILWMKTISLPFQSITNCLWIDDPRQLGGLHGHSPHTIRHYTVNIGAFTPPYHSLAYYVCALSVFRFDDRMDAGRQRALWGRRRPFAPLRWANTAGFVDFILAAAEDAGPICSPTWQPSSVPGKVIWRRRGTSVQEVLLVTLN